MYKNWGSYFMIPRIRIMKTTQYFPNQNLTQYKYLSNLESLAYSDSLENKLTNYLTQYLFNS